jgi:GntR family transcriptional regulator/MocR family aminotransferase
MRDQGIRHVELHVSLAGRTRLRAEIYQQVRRAILDGRLRPGDALPPTRELARRLSVSRNTVEVAYERLAGEGFVISRVGAGTYVSEGSAARTPSTSTAGKAGALQPRPVWRHIPVSTAFVERFRFDFRTGLPDASLFPLKTWRRMVARELRSDSFSSGVYAQPAGHLGLREGIARHIGTSRGVEVSAADIVITSGAQQALDVIARTLIAPGDAVAVEDPGYQPPRRLFLSLGARVVGVPVDHEGIRVDRLPRRCRLVYVTPSHQYPLGIPMSLVRRHALLDWAKRRNAVIVEDDYDSEFRFGGRPLEPLKTLDDSGRVIYVGSFSKTMLPTLRLGFLVAPPSLVDATHRAKFVADWHTSMLMQAALARFIDDGAYALHLRRMSNVYRERHAILTSTLQRDFARELELWPSTNGLHVAAVARGVSKAELDVWSARLGDAGVGVQRLAMFRVDRPAVPGFALAYGAIATRDITEGLRLVRECLDAARRPRPLAKRPAAARV